MTVRMLLLLISVILFVLVAVGVSSSDVDLVAAGLALFAASFLTFLP